jgi:lysophospholipase L1-like esterase
MTRNPFSAANLAEEGARVAEVAGQVSKAKPYHANTLFVTAGTNDIVLDNRAVEQLACDFELLLRRVPSEMHIIMTLIPYTSFREHTGNTQEENLILERLAKNGHFDIVDINPELSADGVLKSEYTFDGIHFNGRAYEIWTGKLMRAAGLSHGQRAEKSEAGVSSGITRIIPQRRRHLMRRSASSPHDGRSGGHCQPQPTSGPEHLGWR